MTNVCRNGPILGPTRRVQRDVSPRTDKKQRNHWQFAPLQRRDDSTLGCARWMCQQNVRIQ